MIDMVSWKISFKFENIETNYTNPETFAARLEKYNQDTAPLLPFYAERGILREVDGMASIEQVTQGVEKALKETA